MICSLIVAVSDNDAIGRKNGLPWHLPEDMKFFKRTTMGKNIVMGRKTYEAIGGPLPGRRNILLTGSDILKVPATVLKFHSMTEVLEMLEKENIEEVFIIGGGKVFETTMEYVDVMYITRVHTVIDDADAFFPAIDHTHWKLVWEEKHDADEQHKFSFVFQKFERIEL